MAASSSKHCNAIRSGPRHPSAPVLVRAVRAVLALSAALYSTDAAAQCVGGLIFLGPTADHARSVWLSATRGAGGYQLTVPGQTVDTWTRDRRGLRLTVSPVVANGTPGEHTLSSTTNGCSIASVKQNQGSVFPQLPNHLPPMLRPGGDGGHHHGEDGEDGDHHHHGGGGDGGDHGNGGGNGGDHGGGDGGHHGGGNGGGNGGGEPGGVTPPIVIPPPTGVMPTVPGGVAPPIATLPPTGVMPTVPGGVAPPIATLPPTGVMPTVPGGVTPPIATLPPTGVMPTVPGGVTPPIGTLPPPTGVTPTRPPH